MELLSTNLPDLYFEDTPVGRMFKETVGGRRRGHRRGARRLRHPLAVRVGQTGKLLQTTIRAQVERQRRQNDIVLIPVGCTENHGRQTVSAMDTLFVSHLCEAVRRRSVKHNGHGPAIALPPLMYGGHPYHHIGMPGTVILRESVVEETLVDVMLGLWNDGFRKHDHRQQPRSPLDARDGPAAVPQALSAPGRRPRHRLAPSRVKDFFRTTEQGGWWDTPFIHADEAETSLGLLLFPEMVDMEQAVETETKQYLPLGHFDNSVDGYHRPQRWSQGEGHFAIEFNGTPEGVVGKPTHARRLEGQAPGRGLLQYLTMIVRRHPRDVPGRHRPAGREDHLPYRRRDGALPARAAERGLEADLRPALDRPALTAAA